MSKFIVICLVLIVMGGATGCAPYVNAGNKNMVTVYVPNTDYESDALALADEHCAKYNESAKLTRKPRESNGIGIDTGSLYDYSCVK